MKKEEIIKYVKEHATSTILSFPDRGSSWGSSSYRGNFSGWIPASIIVRYGCKSVSEIFAGGGTTSDVCRDLEIPYCGIDLNPNPVRPDISVMDILDYTKDLPDGFYQSDLQILHPPYPGINDIHYSNHMWKGDSRSISADIQEMPWEKGMHAVNQAMMRGYAAMPKGAYQAVVVGDIRQKGIFRSMLTNLTLTGEQVQVLIKKQHNTSSGRKYYANHKFFFIEHEYIVITKKPSGYEIAFVVPQHYTMDIRTAKVRLGKTWYMQSYVNWVLLFTWIKSMRKLSHTRKRKGIRIGKLRSDRPYRCLLKLDLLHMLHMENGVLHKEKDTMSRMIQTNMGEMPLQDYLDIRALECGFDSYKELEEAGFSIEISETSKEKENNHDC